MSKQEGIELLQWALPRLGLRWDGFRNVRGQVIKRIGRRATVLGLEGIAAYRRRLESDPGEWRELDALCRVTISRFCRDRGVFELLAAEVLPALATRALDRGAASLRVLSLGCGGGEELYTLSILWRARLAARFPKLELSIIGLDADAEQVKRARAGRYPGGALAELPRELLELGFEREDDAFRVRDEHRLGIELRCQDVRDELPAGAFDLVLCRNLVFTYFGPTLQQELLGRIERALLPSGVLVLGKHESLPGGFGFRELAPGSRVWAKDAPRRRAGLAREGPLRPGQ